MHFLDFKSQKLHGLFYLTQYHSDVVRKKIAIWLLINELHFFKWSVHCIQRICIDKPFRHPAAESRTEYPSVQLQFP